nr:MAG TPA: Albumin I chain a [Bacteriophage sp.]
MPARLTPCYPDAKSSGSFCPRFWRDAQTSNP